MANPAYLPWPEEQEMQLRKLYKIYSKKEIAKLLNRTPAAVKSKLNQLGIKNTEAEFKAKLKRLYCKKTTFKNGQLPHNTKYNGHERINKDGYIEIRVKKGCYKLKHRVVWEKAYGPIAANKQVHFKDGNKQNVTLSNLELISMQENMLRNSKHHIPREVIPTMVLINKLNKKINNSNHG